MDEEDDMGLEDDNETDWKPDEIEEAEEDFIEGAEDDGSFLPSVSCPEMVSVSAIHCYVRNPNNHTMGCIGLSISISITQIDVSWPLSHLYPT